MLMTKFRLLITAGIAVIGLALFFLYPNDIKDIGGVCERAVPAKIEVRNTLKFSGHSIVVDLKQIRHQPGATAEVMDGLIQCLKAQGGSRGYNMVFSEHSMHPSPSPSPSPPPSPLSPMERAKELCGPVGSKFWPLREHVRETAQGIEYDFGEARRTSTDWDNEIQPFGDCLYDSLDKLGVNLVFRNRFDRIDGWSQMSTIVRGPNGQLVEVVVTVSSEMHWRIGSTNIILYDGREVDLRSRIRGTALLHQMQTEFHAIVGIGAASHEQVLGERCDVADVRLDDCEMVRSERRAEYIWRQIKDELRTIDVDLCLMALGRNREPTPLSESDSNYQRRVVIVGLRKMLVKKYDLNINGLLSFDELVRLNKKKHFPLNVSEYSVPNGKIHVECRR